ncbi:MAG: ankyrin repeat domain-containing protein [Alphaproteobacteria bacterium]|nr:ankyrin repeat domain-containing protein [Alphaproteobacteria bacterium]
MLEYRNVIYYAQPDVSQKGGVQGEKRPYDLVIMVGTRHDYEQVDALKEECAKKQAYLAKKGIAFSYTIIGDGHSDIEDKDLEHVQGRLGKGTRVDLWGHGNIDAHGEHTIDIFPDGQRKTSFLFDKLNHLAAKDPRTGQSAPLNVHVWSCHGGASIDAYDHLPKGSSLVSPAGKKHPTLSHENMQGLLNSIQSIPSQKSVHAQFFEDAVSRGETHKIRIPEGTFVIRAPKQTIHKPEEARRYLENQRQEFNEFLTQNMSADPKQASAIMNDINRVSLDDKQMNRYTNSLVLNQTFNKNKDIKAYLRQSGKHPDDILTTDGHPLLKWAIQDGNKALVKTLLEHGANPNYVTPDGRSCLHMATAMGDKEMVKDLLQFGADQQVKYHHRTPLEEAKSLDFSDVAQTILGFFLNLLAEGVKSLMSSNTPPAAGQASVTSQTHDPNQVTTTSLHEAIKLGNRAAVEAFITAGADVSGQNQHGETPLHIAVQSKSEPMVQFLLKFGARTDIANNKGETPLSLASKHNMRAPFYHQNASGQGKQSPLRR